jgi:DNA mismatch endonuclease (patch repair protein)
MTDNHSPAQRRKNMQAVRTKNTAPEKLVRSLLHRLGYRFRLHRKDLAGTPDIVLPARRRLLFVHGCYWHGHNCPRGRASATNVEFWRRKISGNKDRDACARQLLRKEGWKVMIVWQCETKNQARLKERLSRFMQIRPITDKRKAHV